MKNKRGFEFSFGWLFSIIVGTVIIFLAIYASMKLVQTENKIRDSEIGKQLGIILNPIETGIEEGKSDKIVLQSETRLYNKCLASGTFGVQEIRIATKSGIGEKWPNPGVPSSFNNKYIFSSDIVEGKEYRIFAKPFEMPFKIADLIYMWPINEEYCFINPPGEIEDEVNDLGLGINVSNSITECSKKSKKVCFTSSGCDIDVSLGIGNELRGSVTKKENFISNKVYFEKTELLYGAIFASPEMYDCQIKRLTGRGAELALLYGSKSVFLSVKGCGSNLDSDLKNYANKSLAVKNSLDLREISAISDNIRRVNEDLLCRLF